MGVGILLREHKPRERRVSEDVLKLKTMMNLVMIGTNEQTPGEAGRARVTSENKQIRVQFHPLL